MPCSGGRLCFPFLMNESIDSIEACLFDPDLLHCQSHSTENQLVRMALVSTLFVFSHHSLGRKDLPVSDGREIASLKRKGRKEMPLITEASGEKRTRWWKRKIQLWQSCNERKTNDTKFNMNNASKWNLNGWIMKQMMF